MTANISLALAQASHSTSHTRGPAHEQNKGLPQRVPLQNHAPEPLGKRHVTLRAYHYPYKYKLERGRAEVDNVRNFALQPTWRHNIPRYSMLRIVFQLNSVSSTRNSPSSKVHRNLGPRSRSPTAGSDLFVRLVRIDSTQDRSHGVKWTRLVDTGPRSHDVKSLRSPLPPTTIAIRADAQLVTHRGERGRVTVRQTPRGRDGDNVGKTYRAILRMPVAQNGFVLGHLNPGHLLTVFVAGAQPIPRSPGILCLQERRDVSSMNPFFRSRRVVPHA